MPISSGANDWPKEYFKKPDPDTNAASGKAVAIPRPASPFRARPAPPQTQPVVFLDQPQPGPPGMATYIAGPPTQNVVLIDQPRTLVPPSQHVIVQGAPPPPQPMTVIQNPGAPTYVVQQPPPPGYGVRRYPQGYTSYQEYYGRGTDDGCLDPNCCADPYFTTGKSGADAGCCQGGMFGSRRYPFHPSQNYILKGTGRGRCCAFVWGILLGLAALGLLLGMLLGYLPTTQIASAKTSVANQFTGGYWSNGVYYYPITNPPYQFYYALGPGIPCNKFNNNSSIQPPATAGVMFVSDALSTDTVTYPAGTTGTTLPNCNQVTTSFVLVGGGLSVPTTTYWPPVLLSEASRTTLCSCLVTTSSILQVLAIFLPTVIACILS